MKFTTPVSAERLSTELALSDKIMVLGSCFADNIGQRLADSGFNVCVNPFGTLYNPASVATAVSRLTSGAPFTAGDCVEMGAGAGKICSFEHHTSFARPDAEDFLTAANSSLAEASAFWRSCNRVIITFGTAMVWIHGGKVVSNCLKRPAKEFSHEMLSVDEICRCISAITQTVPGVEEKRFIFTVSPIRHPGDGAHVNTLSKASLQLAVSRSGCDYFPAYEIMLDELRDYRFYAEDLVHPSRQAVEYIYEKFRDAAFRPEDLPRIVSNEKSAAASRHVEGGIRGK